VQEQFRVVKQMSKHGMKYSRLRLNFSNGKKDHILWSNTYKLRHALDD